MFVSFCPTSTHARNGFHPFSPCRDNVCILTTGPQVGPSSMETFPEAFDSSVSLFVREGPSEPLAGLPSNSSFAGEVPSGLLAGLTSNFTPVFWWVLLFRISYWGPEGCKIGWTGGRQGYPYLHCLPFCRLFHHHSVSLLNQTLRSRFRPQTLW